MSERELVKNIKKVKKRVYRIIEIKPEMYKKYIYIEGYSPLFMEAVEEKELKDLLINVVAAYKRINDQQLVKIVNEIKKVVVKMFSSFGIELIEDVDEFEALMDEELIEYDYNDLDASYFVKTRYARSMVLITLVIFSLVFKPRPDVIAYAFLSHIVFWYMMRLVERQIFEKEMILSAREVLPWFSLILISKLMLRTSMEEAFRKVISSCKENATILTIILGVQLTHILIKFNSWKNMMYFMISKSVETISDEEEEMA